MKRSLLLVVAVGCVTELPSSDPTVPAPLPGDNGGTAGDGSNTYNHPDPPDPWDILDRLIEEGPPSYTAHVHSCMKLKYSTLGTVLTSRGVNLAATGSGSAGALYTQGDQALGVANYAQRVPEGTDLTTSGASKMLDIFASAAPEIIAAIPTRTECQSNGTAAAMFDASNNCTAQGIECITGLPSSPAQVELCSQIVLHASTVDIGKNMAVAVTMAAAQTCE